MIYDYFSKVQKKLETLKWIIVEQSVNFDFVSEEMGIRQINFCRQYNSGFYGAS